RRVDPAGARCLVVHPQTRHAPPRPRRGPLCRDRAGDVDEGGLGDPSHQWPSVSREAAPLLLAHSADLPAVRSVGMGDPALVGDLGARHGPSDVAHRASAIRLDGRPPGWSGPGDGGRQRALCPPCVDRPTLHLLPYPGALWISSGRRTAGPRAPAFLALL